MIKEFKKFILRGNVIDLAVGIIIGAAFNKIVSSLVNDIIMPVISYITSLAGERGLNIADWVITLKHAPEGAADAADITINAGIFITYVLDFLFTGFVVFMIVKIMNKLSETKTRLIGEDQAEPAEEKETV